MSKPLRKDEKNAIPVSDQVTPPSPTQGLRAPAAGDRVREHPLFSGAKPMGLMSAHNPRVKSPEFKSNDDAHQRLGQALKEMGLEHEPTHGAYDVSEDSYIIHGPTREQMYELGKKFGQESVIYGEGGKHEFMYTTGSKAGRFHPSLPGYEAFEDHPENYWTHLPSHNLFFRLNFDFDNLHSAPLGQTHAMDALQQRGGTSDQVQAETMKSAPEIAQSLTKSRLYGKGDHPFREAAFRHIPSGSVIATGSHHDLNLVDADAFDRGEYDEGFLDHSGKFHTREQASAVLKPGVAGSETGLENELHSDDLFQSEKLYDLTEAMSLLAQSLKKFLPGQSPQKSLTPHPHAYHWHDHSDHHVSHGHGGVLISRKGLMKADGSSKVGAHPHMDGSKPATAMDSPEHAKNDQAAGVGVSTYAKFAMPYGSVNSGSPTNLNHYRYEGKRAHIDQLVKDHGYQTYYAGGKYGRPDLANRNYNTKHLMVYDPSPGSGGDFGHEEYTDGWRKIHELSHALVYPELNKVYGEGRRIGKLGNHRTVREALRAVHWEWLAAHKQRELSKHVGVDISDDDFHKELNTVMHDAVHRAVTGKFTEPSGEGFAPHNHKIPLETALGMIRESAHNLGLTGMHDLLKKTEEPMADEKEYSVDEVRQMLAKNLNERVQEYQQHLLELRQRELSKAEKPLCKGCGKSHLEKGCGSKVLDKSAIKATKDVTPSGHGSGGKVKKGKIPGLKKQDVPTSKPAAGAGGAAPKAPAAPKMAAPKMATPKPAAAPAAPAAAKPTMGMGKSVTEIRNLAKASPLRGTGGADLWNPDEGSKPAAAAKKPTFGAADLAAGKAKLSAQGVKPGVGLAGAKPPAGTGHLNAPVKPAAVAAKPPPVTGAAPKIPAAAAAPGAQPPSKALAAAAPAQKPGLLDRFKSALKSKPAAAPTSTPKPKSEPSA